MYKVHPGLYRVKSPDAKIRIRHTNTKSELLFEARSLKELVESRCLERARFGDRKNVVFVVGGTAKC